MREKIKYGGTVILCVFFLTGCLPSVVTRMHPIESNPEFLNRLVMKVAENVVKTSPYIIKGKIYGLLDMKEGDSKDDDPLKVTIEDALRIAITEGGGKIAERDDDVLFHILLEESGDTVTSVLSSKFRLTHLYDLRVDNSKLIELLLGHSYKPTFLDDISLFRSKEEEALYLGPYFIDAFKKSRVITPDYILAFRVYEIGIRLYDDFPDDEEYTREACVDIFVEILDAKTGTVVWAKRVKDTLSDRVPVETIPYLKESGFVFYPYPVLEGKESSGMIPLKMETEERIIQEKKTEVKKGEKSEKPKKGEKSELKGIKFYIGFASGINTLLYQDVMEETGSYGYDLFLGYVGIKHLSIGLRTSGTFNGTSYIKLTGDFAGRIPFNPKLELSIGLKIGYISLDWIYNEDSFFIAPGLNLEYLFFQNGGLYLSIDYGFHQLFARAYDNWMGEVGGLLGLNAGLSFRF